MSNQEALTTHLKLRYTRVYKLFHRNLLKTLNLRIKIMKVKNNNYLGYQKQN